MKGTPFWNVINEKVIVACIFPFSRQLPASLTAAEYDQKVNVRRKNRNGRIGQSEIKIYMARFLSPPLFSLSLSLSLSLSPNSGLRQDTERAMDVPPSSGFPYFLYLMTRRRQLWPFRLGVGFRQSRGCDKLRWILSRVLYGAVTMAMLKSARVSSRLSLPPSGTWAPNSDTEAAAVR